VIILSIEKDQKIHMMINVNEVLRAIVFSSLRCS